MMCEVYDEYPPPRALAWFVECFWRRDVPAAYGGEAGLESGLVLAVGRVDLVWVVGGEARVAGPQTRSLARPFTPPFVAIGARFRPGVGPPLLGLPAHELVDMHVPLASADTSGAATLSARLARVDEPSAAPRALAGAIAALAADGEPLDPLVPRAAQLLGRSEISVNALGRRLGLSERQLRRRFREAVGYGPKTLQRVLRFQRFLAEVGSDPPGGLAAAAAASGYADQAHLTRESRRLSGLTPRQLEVRGSA